MHPRLIKPTAHITWNRIFVTIFQYKIFSYYISYKYSVKSIQLRKMLQIFISYNFSVAKNGLLQPPLTTSRIDWLDADALTML